MDIVTNMTIENYTLADDALQLDGLEKAIVGVSEDGYLIYHYDKIVDVFVQRDGMDYDEAQEWTDYNVLGVSCNGNWTIMFPVDND